MNDFARKFVIASLVLIYAHASQAQKAPSDDELMSELTGQTPSASNNNEGPRGIIPIRRGFNLSVVTASQHDSAAGWSNILTPNVAYRFNRHFSADASTPVAVYLLFTNVTGTAAKPKINNIVEHFIPGDTVVAGHAEFLVPRLFTYTFTPSLSLPSGDSTVGFGGARTTYDFNNHFESTLPLSPFIELGIGDNSALVNRRTKKGQQSTGIISHFEFGGAIDLPRSCSFSASVYELLPVGDQNIYSTTTVRKQTVTKITGTTGLAEDNGFNTALDIPLNPHSTLSGFYNRSLRQHNDTAGFSIAFLLRARQTE